MIQNRIRERRQDFGASVEAMASWARLSAERWRAIENGDALNAAELGKVARALAVDPGILLRGEERSPRRSVVRFRSAAPPTVGPTPHDSRTLALAAELGRIGGGLCRLLGRPHPLEGQRRPEPITDGEEPWRQGYRLAEVDRRALGPPTGPIPDLGSALENLGVHTALVPFSEPSIDAASLMEEGAVPILLLNSRSLRIARTLPRRAAMGHELCHLLHDVGEHDLETQMSRSSGEELDDGIEQRARAYAPAFLAPRDEVRHWFRVAGGQRFRRAEAKVEALAKRWGLSRQGAVWHAKNCGIITSATAELLAREPRAEIASESGPATEESSESRADWQDEFEASHSTRSHFSLEGMPTSKLCEGHIADLVGMALEAGAISEGRAREILGWG